VDANKSFYQYTHLLGGISFGVAELTYLRNGDFADARVLLGALISLGFLVGLLIKKKKLMDRKLHLAALARRYPHICADYCCSIGATALFSLLAYVVINDVSFFERGWVLTRFSFAIILNFGVFFAGMWLLSAAAGEERVAP
jgi:hypothetical protein